MSQFQDRNAYANIDIDYILSGRRRISTSDNLIEAIETESDLVSKLTKLQPNDIYDFMKNLHNGTFFNMGTYKIVPLARAYKKTYSIYKVTNHSAIVTGSSYENIKTTKDYRASTGAVPMPAWYNHEQGYENKIGSLKSDPSKKYVMWNIKKTSGSWVAYYLIDLQTGLVTPVSRDSLKHSDYITETEKRNLGLLASDEEIIGWDATAGKFIIAKNPARVTGTIRNETEWRTTKFENIFWLSQADREYGAKFEESLTKGLTGDLAEEATGITYRDRNKGAVDIDSILSGEFEESCGASVARKQSYRKHKNLGESYRRIVSKGSLLIDNDLFVDFD